MLQGQPETWSKECWQGGRLYQTKGGDEVFVPTGAKRGDVPKDCGPLRYLGAAIRNVKGWDDSGDGNPPRPEMLPLK